MKKLILSLLLLAPFALWCQTTPQTFPVKQDSVILVEYLSDSCLVIRKGDSFICSVKNGSNNPFKTIKKVSLRAKVKIIKDTISKDTTFFFIDKNGNQKAKDTTITNMMRIIQVNNICHYGDTLILIPKDSSCVEVFEAATRQEEFPDGFPWLKVLAIIAIMAVLAWVIVYFLLPRIRSKSYISKEFNLKIRTDFNVQKTTEKLKKCAPNINIEANKPRVGYIRFEINQDNLPEEEEPFITELMKSSCNLYDDDAEKNLQNIERFIKRIKRIRTTIDRRQSKDVSLIKPDNNPTTDLTPIEQPGTESGQPEDEITSLRIKLKELQESYDSLSKEYDEFKDKVNKINSDHNNEISKLNNDKQTLKESKEKIEKEKKELESTIEKIKKEPKDFKNQKGYDKLTKLIVAGEKFDKICDNPDDIGQDTEVGKLIKNGRLLKQILENPEKILTAKGSEQKPLTIMLKKGQLLDDIKKNPDLILSNNEFQSSNLQTLVKYVDKPEEITKSNLNAKGLYQLVKDIEGIANNNNVQYPWLSNIISKTIANAKQYEITQQIASSLDQNSSLNVLSGQIQEVFRKAQSYMQFMGYENYWKNLRSPLSDTLNNLYLNNEHNNIRTLIFYASQLYSMSCIMNELYGDNRISTKRHKINVSAFNTPNLSTGAQGFPQPNQDDLNACLFEYKGAANEDQIVNYLKAYKPLPFIFINSYYSDDILS